MGLGHDSIPLKVILLFPPLLVSPSRGFQGGNLWLSNFSGPLWGLFPLDIWLSLALYVLVLFHGHSLVFSWLFLALSGSLCLSWHSLAFFLCSHWHFWDVSSSLSSKTSGKTPVKILRKILS